MNQISKLSPFVAVSVGAFLCACGAGGTQLGAVDPNTSSVQGNGNSNVGVSSVTPTVLPSGANSGKYTNLIWTDEFSGTALDTNKWSYEVNCDGGGNNEDECYTLDSNNVFCDGQGDLVIRVIKSNTTLSNGKTYTSGRITSSGKGDFIYGRWEARIKVPKGQGFWPAFWTMPTDNTYGGWPTSGELDIMEILGGNSNTLYGTAHYGVPSPYTQSGGQTTTADFSTDFHIFALERELHQIRWYVDGTLYYTLNDTSTTFWPANSKPADGTVWPFTKRYFTILNVAMGGNWPGTPDPSITTGDMVVDYVRIFQ